MPKLHAQPYDLDAIGFYFESVEEYQTISLNELAQRSSSSPSSSDSRNSTFANADTPRTAPGTVGR